MEEEESGKYRERMKKVYIDGLTIFFLRTVIDISQYRGYPADFYLVCTHLYMIHIFDIVENVYKYFFLLNTY